MAEKRRVLYVARKNQHINVPVVLEIRAGMSAPDRIPVRNSKGKLVVYRFSGFLPVPKDK